MKPKPKELYMQEIKELCNTYDYRKQFLIDAPYDLETINKLNIKYGNKDIKFVRLDNDNSQIDVPYDLETINKLNIKNGNKDIKFVRLDNDNSRIDNKYNVNYNDIVYYTIIMFALVILIITCRLIIKL